MNMSTKFPCPGCKSSLPVNFKKPHVLEPTMLNVSCEECNSLVSFKIAMPAKAEGRKENEIKFQSRVLKPSNFLIRMLAEEAEHQAQQEKELQNG